VDTDDLARAVVAAGEPGLSAVTREFGSQVIGPDGELKRGALAEIVFRDPAARVRLEGILHPLIRERWQRRAQTWRDEGKSLGVVVIPLLFEAGLEGFFESVVCIACTFERQSARLQTRGWSAEQVTGRLSAQWAIEKKMERSQYVIWNDASVSVMRAQLGRIPPLKGRL
jgi:dephospho-CoA kinase